MVNNELSALEFEVAADLSTDMGDSRSVMDMGVSRWSFFNSCNGCLKKKSDLILNIEKRNPTNVVIWKLFAKMVLSNLNTH